MTVAVAPVHRTLKSNELFVKHGFPPLTEDQQRVVATLHRACYLNTTDETATEAVQAVLEGPAGTGKTTLLIALVLEAALHEFRVAVTAPTHKAAQVLTNKLQFWQEKYPTLLIPDAVTIHSFLRLKPKKVTPKSPEGFVQSSRPPSFKHYDLIILDECSMVGEELFKYADATRNHFKGLLLFTGDPFQLPPVNERRKSKTFESKLHIQLTEVLRHGGPILDLATKVRKFQYIPQIFPAQNEESEIKTFDSEVEILDDWLEELHDLHLSNPEAVHEYDEIVLLCWMNKNRRTFNKLARARLFGKNAPPYQDGVVLIALKPIMSNKSDDILYGNNASIRIESAVHFNKMPIPTMPEYAYDMWQLVTAENHTIYVIADHEREQWEKDIRALGKVIQKEVETTQAALDQGLAIRKNKSHPTGISHADLTELRNRASDAKSRWPTEYFRLKEFFADVDYGYALTIHKSQGSTYSNVYVFPDYTKSRNESVPLLYVALTRASKKVVHLYTGIKKRLASAG